MAQNILFYHTLTHFLQSILRALIHPLIAMLSSSVDLPAARLGSASTSGKTTTIVSSTATSTALSTSTSSTVTTSTTTTPTLPITPRPRPLPNSYWATPHLLACEYPYNPLHPTLPHLRTLLLTGIRTFIDLTEPGELVPYSSLLPSLAQSLGIPPEEVKYYNFAIKDRSPPLRHRF
ncbi:hypothetical protein BDQ17DRAFT_237506 [Cyathus striatus]|nr:hypothetical protein BDQ17DRAFT_237506 [Cyathus striatus]